MPRPSNTLSELVNLKIAIARLDIAFREVETRALEMLEPKPRPRVSNTGTVSPPAKRPEPGTITELPPAAGMSISPHPIGMPIELSDAAGSKADAPKLMVRRFVWYNPRTWFR